MTERFGSYEILRKIAAGGMAEVFLAKHTGLGGFERLVCIKKILPHLGEQDEFIKMFQDEARIAANIIHPNIAQIYDIGAADESYYIAMEYVRGEDLRRVYNQEVGRGRAMPGEQAAQIVMYAAAGLDFAHRQATIDGQPMGIVHRDISPQNLLVSYDGHVKIVDFGVAKAQGKLAETRAGVLKGKYSYMSPEQASGDPIDGRTDVFALGITLYEVTTGTRLFKRESEIETLHAVIACSVREPRSVNPSYDPELEAIVLRALEKRPQDRFPSAGDMERALERYLIERGYPTGASSLAAYMHDLFADKLGDDSFSFSASASARRDTHEDRPATRALTPPDSSRGATAQPQIVENENTHAEESAGELGFTGATSVAGSGSWPSSVGWSAVHSQPESQTQTQAASGQKERAFEAGQPLLMDHQVTEPSKLSPAGTTRKRPSPWSVVSFSGVIVALIAAVTLVMISRSGSEAVPHSGPLAIDSEPRGARVLFKGYGSDVLNERYSGAETPYTISEGIPVGSILRGEFVREGYSRVEVDIPAVSDDVTPPPLFAELVADTEPNKAVLSFTSDPVGAEVYVGGNKIEGTTPIEEVQVTARQLHRIEVRLADHHPHVESVYVEPGGREMITAYLRALDGFEDPTAEPDGQEQDADPNLDDPATPEDGVEEVEPAKPQRAAAPKRRSRGYLRVDAPIPLKVYAGGKLVGKTPIKREAIAAGSTRIRLESATEGLVLNRRVRIRSGEITELKLDLKRGNVALQASPWARVKRGKQQPVETPTRLTGLLEGDYRLRFECPDGTTQTKTATVRPGGTATLRVDCRAE